MRTRNKNTIDKYYRFLVLCQQKSGQISDCKELTGTAKVSNSITTFLRENNIIYKIDNVYYWNNTYQPNIKMVYAYLDKVKKYNASRKKQRVIQFKSDDILEQNINSDIVGKIWIQDAVRMFGKSDSFFRRVLREWKVSKPYAISIVDNKIYFDLNELNKKLKKQPYEMSQSIQLNDKAQVGIIRKFIKWLW